MVGFWRVCVKMGVLVMWHDGLYEGGLCVEWLVGCRNYGGMWGTWKDGRLYDGGLFYVEYWEDWCVWTVG